VFSLMLKEVPLRTMSGLQAAREAAAAQDPDAVDEGGATHDPEQPAGTLTR